MHYVWISSELFQKGFSPCNNLSCFRHDNVQCLEKMKQLVLFIERKLEEKVGHIPFEDQILISFINAFV